MATVAKKTIRSRQAAGTEKAFTYRGVKIAPAAGRRSPLAKEIRDGLRKMAEQSRGQPAQA